MAARLATPRSATPMRQACARRGGAARRTSTTAPMDRASPAMAIDGMSQSVDGAPDWYGTITRSATWTQTRSITGPWTDDARRPLTATAMPNETAARTSRALEMALTPLTWR